MTHYFKISEMRSLQPSKEVEGPTTKVLNPFNVILARMKEIWSSEDGLRLLPFKWRDEVTINIITSRSFKPVSAVPKTNSTVGN